MCSSIATALCYFCTRKFVIMMHVALVKYVCKLGISIMNCFKLPLKYSESCMRREMALFGVVFLYNG